MVLSTLTELQYCDTTAVVNVSSQIGDVSALAIRLSRSTGSHAAQLAARCFQLNTLQLLMQRNYHSTHIPPHISLHTTIPVLSLSLLLFVVSSRPSPSRLLTGPGDDDASRSRQGRLPHQVKVDLPRRLPPLVDGVHHQGLASSAICKQRQKV